MKNQSGKTIYLDHAGAAVPTPALLKNVANSLTTNGGWLANPHSGHAMGQKARAMLQKARSRILTHFGSDPSKFAVIFTANATTGLKLLAETFNGDQFDGRPKEFSNNLECLTDPSKSTLLMLNDSHTSVMGMRQIGRFDRIVVADFDELKEFLNEFNNKKRGAENGTTSTKSRRKDSLLVMTAMSNFCGRIYDPRIGELLRRTLGPYWRICFDAAALAPHSADIGLAECDFAVISFSKMFGYPTGLGALLIRRECANLLKKGYFGGGTVNYASIASMDVHFRDDISERFEDGTPNIYAIHALLLAFETEERGERHEKKEKDEYRQHIGMELAERAFDFLTHSTHANGAPLAIVYGRGWAEKRSNYDERAGGGGRKLRQGPIVNFNLLRADGSFVGFVEVDRMADLFGIQLRTGCHCNLGACAMHLGLDEKEMSENYEMGKVCGDDVDQFDGRPLGSVRISFGRTSTEQDFVAFRQMLECCFLSSGQNPRPLEDINGNLFQPPPLLGHLTHLFIYPIKSCGAIRTKNWPICPLSGALLHDRRWLIVHSGTGEWLTQKRYPTLCAIQPEIDMQSNELIMEDRHKMLQPLRLPFLPIGNLRKEESVAKQKSGGISCYNGSGQLVDFGGNATSKWLEQLDDSLAGCQLVMMANDGQCGEAPPPTTGHRNFSNQANYLLITCASVEFIAEHLSMPVETVTERFRPNLVVDFGPGWRPFQEEQIKRLAIGSFQFKVVGVCQRCQMICIDQSSGDKDPNVLLGLRNTRLGVKGTLVFGVYLELEQGESFVGRRELHTGCTVRLLE